MRSTPFSRRLPFLKISLIILFFSSPCFASPSKEFYTVFNPTPKDLLRELSPDRPDITESPYTVDAGHYQLEMDFVRFIADSSSQFQSEQTTIFPFNFKIGLLNDVDLQLGYDPYTYIYEKEKQERQSAHHEGTGDTTIRLKWNWFGNDEEGSALGLMPFITLPTSSNNVGDEEVSGGLIIPYAVDTGSSPWSLGLMAEFDFIPNEEANEADDVVFVDSATVSREIIQDLGLFLEFVSVADTENSWNGFFSSGLTYAVSDNLLLDGGTVLGVNDAAEDASFFLGMTLRQ